MPKANLRREIVEGSDLTEKIKSGVDKIYQVALASYGANSGNVLIEYRYGEPLISHDGITNVGSLVVADPIENAAISIVRQASERTNKESGDATTLTIVLTKLAYYYYSKHLNTLPVRQIQTKIEDQVKYITDLIDSTAIPATPDTLKGVAKISAGDQAIGDMISDAISTVGSKGGITVVEVPEPQVSTEVINGFTFKQGLKLPVLANDLQSVKSRYSDPAVIILPKLVSKNDDILPILDKLLRAGKTQIILVADVSGQALETIVSNKINGSLDIAIIEPLAKSRDLFLSDLAQYANTKQFTGTPEDFDLSQHLGSVDSAYITLGETTLNGTKDPEALAKYSENIDDEDRLARLNGKSFKISVGSPTQAERQELKLRIEDAICASQTASEYGVLAGGGVFLRDIDNGTYLSEPFNLLTDSPSKFLKGSGVDLETGRVLQDMIHHNIVDSAKAIKEAVINSHSAASQLLSVKLALPFTEDIE